MPDEIERIVNEVLVRLGQGSTEDVYTPVTRRVAAASSAPLKPVLVLTEDLGRVSTVLGSASRRQRQAISVFVGGSSRHRSNAAVFGELFFVDDARHARTDFVGRFDTFVLCGVSLPTIARLAQLIVTEPLERVVFNALSHAKAVLMEPIATNPSFAPLPSGMREEFSRFAHRLTELGVREETVDSIFGLEPLVMSTGVAGQDSQLRSGAPVILTVHDIQEYTGPGSRLTVTGAYRLTDLAREYVEKNGITIEML